MGRTPVSAREAEVLALLGAHLTHVEIATRLSLSVRTVESHVASLRRKLDLPGHRDLVRYAAAQRRGVLSPSAPSALTSFVGRAGALSATSDALAGSRLVTLAGPGGAGKTRLAQELLTRLDETAYDSVWLVDLVPVSDPAVLTLAVAEACGLDDQPAAEAVVALARGLGRGRGLLVLDNCEHLVGAVATLVDRLLGACPALTVLATSRSRLELPAEHVVPIGPLTDEEAVELFCRRAVAAGWPAPGEAERERLRRVCQRLDGLALAVELAAVRVPSLGLDGLEEALSEQTELLVARPRSMREALEWSWALLPPEDQRLMTSLAVFVSGFDRAAAAAVAARDPLAGISRLVDHHLVIPQPDQRWRILEPIRQFALARAPTSAYAAHAAWVTTAAKATGSGGDVDLEPLLDELRAAVVWLIDALPVEAAEPAHQLAITLFKAGHLREAQDRFVRAAQVTDDPCMSAAWLCEAAEIAKCRTLGDAAHRLEVQAVELLLERAPARVGPVARRAAETPVRFEGLCERRPDPAVIEHLSSLATPPAPEDVLAESAAADTRTSDLIEAGSIDEAVLLARDRVSLLLHEPLTPGTALELKDALHMAALSCVGAGDLKRALTYAETQLGLPFLREQRDLAVDELLLPLALSHDDAAALNAATLFKEDWEAAGRPVAPGRAIGPAAIAYLHGVRGARAGRREWLGVVAALRGVPRPLATEGTGYGEVFDAALALHHGRPADAAAALARAPTHSWYTALFTRWRTDMKNQLRPGTADTIRQS